MKTMLATAALCLAAATTFAQSNIQVGGNIGYTWPMSGDSPIGQDVLGYEPNGFGDDFNSGISFGAYATGPLSGMLGWRIDGGFDKLNASDDDAIVDLDYKTFRYMAGLQIANYETESKGRPYGFVVAGGIHEDGEIETEDELEEEIDAQYDFDGRTAFGMSFGGGYNYNVGESWGLGLDLHFNVGFFEDSTRWFWTPSAQIFFSF